VPVRWRRRTPREVDPMAMRASQEARRPVRRSRGTPAPGRVVAVILDDGSIRVVDRPGQAASEGPPWASGSVSGRNWTLWWERRTWQEDRGT
jgi:hypothetical protein